MEIKSFVGGGIGIGIDPEPLLHQCVFSMPIPILTRIDALSAGLQWCQ